MNFKTVHIKLIYIIIFIEYKSSISVMLLSVIMKQKIKKKLNLFHFFNVIDLFHWQISINALQKIKVHKFQCKIRCVVVISDLWIYLVYKKYVYLLISYENKHNQQRQNSKIYPSQPIQRCRQQGHNRSLFFLDVWYFLMLSSYKCDRIFPLITPNKHCNM